MECLLARWSRSCGATRGPHGPRGAWGSRASTRRGSARTSAHGWLGSALDSHARPGGRTPARPPWALFWRRAAGRALVAHGFRQQEQARHKKRDNAFCYRTAFQILPDRLPTRRDSPHNYGTHRVLPTSFSLHVGSTEETRPLKVRRRLDVPASCLLSSRKRCRLWMTTAAPSSPSRARQRPEGSRGLGELAEPDDRLEC